MVRASEAVESPVGRDGEGTEQPAASPARGRRLRRTERREQILTAATSAFARTGFAATSLDDVAAQAGVTKVLIYRHFDSKAGLYQAVLDGFCSRLQRAVGDIERLQQDSLEALISAAAAEPDAFRLLFRHVAHEPEFRAYADEFRTGMTTVAEQNLRDYLPDPRQRQWAAELIPVVAIEAIMTWLDTGQHNPESISGTVQTMIDGVLAAIGTRY